MTEEQIDKMTKELLDEIANKTDEELQKDVDEYNKAHGICPSSCAPDAEDDESSVDEESEEETDENGMCDTMDLIDEILGFPKKTPEEKVEYLKRVEERRQRLIELERENQEWQEFKRPYLLEAEQRAARDYEEYKKSKSSEQAHRTRTNVNKSNHNL